MRWGKEHTSRKKDSIPMLMKRMLCSGVCAQKAHSELNQTDTEQLFRRDCPSERPRERLDSTCLCTQDHCCSQSSGKDLA